mmetsp:Transcript_10870/g.26680  ORF Transcript_10870/g.26680 Transcript_10870/m.26680 type:complete len:301 (+) Transcript_10870:323-1225(+)
MKLGLQLLWLPHAKRLSNEPLPEVAHQSLLDDLRVDLFRQQFLAEGAEQIWLHQDVEAELFQHEVLQQVQLFVAEHREQFRQAAVPHRLVLPHLVRQQQRDQKQGAPRGGVQRDVGALLEAAQVDDRNDEGRHGEDALVQDGEDERGHVQCRSVVHAGAEHVREAVLHLSGVVLLLKEVRKRPVLPHAVLHVLVGANVPVEKVDPCTKKLQLQGDVPLGAVRGDRVFVVRKLRRLDDERGCGGKGGGLYRLVVLLAQDFGLVLPSFAFLLRRERRRRHSEKRIEKNLPSMALPRCLEKND